MCVCGVSGVSGACVTGEGETYSQYKNVRVGGRRDWEGAVVLVLVEPFRCQPHQMG